MAKPDDKNKRNVPDEKHSLSSYAERRKGNYVIGNAQQREHSKTYKVYSTQRTNTVSNEKGNTVSAEKSKRAYSANLSHSARNGGTKGFSSYEDKDAGRTHESGMSADNAQQMRKAAYIGQMNQAAQTSSPQADTARTAQENRSDMQPERKYQNNTDNTSSAQTSSIDSVTEKRLKRAAYLEQRNEENVNLNRVTVIKDSDESGITDSQTENDEEDVPPEHLEKQQETMESETDNKENHYTFDGHYTDKDEMREHFKYKMAKDSQQKAKKLHRSGLDALVSDGRLIAQLGKGEVGAAAVDIIKEQALSPDETEVVNTISDITNAVNNSSFVSGAVMDVSATLAAIEAKKMVKNLAEKDVNIIDRISERLKKHGNRYGIEKYNEVVKQSAKGKREAKEAKRKEQETYQPRLNNTVQKVGNSKKSEQERKEYVKKQKAKEINNKKKDIFVKEEQKLDNNVFSAGGSGGIGRRILKKKSSALIIGAGGAAFFVVFIVLVVIILISVFFGWLSRFTFDLAGDDTEVEAITEEEVINSYCLMIQNYFEYSKYSYYLAYGNYVAGDATYDFQSAAAFLDWGEYYEEYLKPKIEEAQEEITERYQPQIAAAAKNGDYSLASSLGQQMSKEIAETVSTIIEEGKDYFDETIEQLDDIYSEPEDKYLNKKEKKHFDPPYCTETKHTELKGGRDDTNDMEQYNGEYTGGTNQFALSSLKIPTDLTAEDILQYMALANSLSFLADKPEEDDGESIYNDDPVITKEEINNFFEKTKFVQITVEMKTGICSGCKRRLVGSWEGGWRWIIYCKGDETNGGDPNLKHRVLTGSITCLSEEELLQAVMTEYNAENAGLSEKDCRSLIEEYKEYIKDTIGDTQRQIGANYDGDSTAWFELLEYDGYGTYGGGWIPTSPLKQPEEETEEENQ